MPLDETSSRELKAQLNLAKSATLGFGLALGKKPEDTALILDKKRPPELLLKEAKKAPGVDKQKCCAGTLAVEGSTVLLNCEEAPPTGAVKKLKAFFKAAKITLKPRVVSPDGTEFEAEPDEAAAPQEAAPGNADDGTSPDGQQADAPPPPPPPPPPMELMKRLKAAQPQIAALEGPAAPKLKGAYRDVAARVQSREFDAASAMLSKIEAALEKLAAAQSAAQPADQPASQSANAPETADAGSGPEAGAEADDPHKSRWEDMFKYRSELVAEAATAGSVDPSKLRAAWAMAVEKAEAGQYKAADAIGERVEKLIAQGGGDGHDAKNDAESDAKKWALTKRKIDEVLTYVFMSNAGEMDRIRAIWDEMLACDKAKDYAGALALVPELQTVLKGVQEEQKKRKAKEQADKKAQAKVARKSVTALLKDFDKIRKTRLRAALDLDPTRKREAGKLTKEMRKAVKALDTETAQETLLALETLCEDCEALQDS